MFSFLSSHKTRPVSAAEALPGRPDPMPVTATHRVNGRPMTPPYPDGPGDGRSSAWAASGAPNGSSGSSTASG